MARTLRLPVPTHILTGSLNSGKTSLILHLLASKPEDEVWAVLVNEMGAVGVDQAVLASADGAVVRQLTGGCLCCTLSTVTSAAIVQLLRKAKPDRFLIEPSGLAHPDPLLALLQGPHLKTAISLHPTVCLVDLTRFSGNSKEEEEGVAPEIFSSIEDSDTLLNQIEVADILLGTKADLCSEAQVAAFKQWAAQRHPLKRVLICENSQISLDELEKLGDNKEDIIKDQKIEQQNGIKTQQPIASASRGPGARIGSGSGSKSTPWLTNAIDSSPVVPSPRAPVRMQNNTDDGTNSTATPSAATCGWLFHQVDIFDKIKLLEFSEAVAMAPGVLRLKALCRVGENEWIHISSGGAAHSGVKGIGMVNLVNVSEAPKQAESRIEIIVPVVMSGVGDGAGGVPDDTYGYEEEGPLPLLRRAVFQQDWECIEKELIRKII